MLCPAGGHGLHPECQAEKDNQTLLPVSVCVCVRACVRDVAGICADTSRPQCLSVSVCSKNTV